MNRAGFVVGREPAFVALASVLQLFHDASAELG